MKKENEYAKTSNDINWSKIPKGTSVLVSHDYVNWREQSFLAEINGLFITTMYNIQNNSITPYTWKYCKVPNYALDENLHLHYGEGGVNMSKLNELDELQKEYSSLIEQGYEPIVITLYGSQNYNLADEFSDVDARTMVKLPLTDIILGNSKLSINTSMNSDVNPDGINTIKDIKSMIDTLKKGNVSFLEILTTKYYICNSKYENVYMKLRSMVEDFVNYDLNKTLSGMVGMFFQKYDLLTKEVESKKDIIAKYGYDPKQLVHMFRLCRLIESIYSGETLKSALILNEDDLIYAFKLKDGTFNKEEAITISEYLLSKIKALKEQFNYTADKEFQNKVDKELDKLILEVYDIEIKGE